MSIRCCQYSTFMPPIIKANKHNFCNLLKKLFIGLPILRIVDSTRYLFENNIC